MKKTMFSIRRSWPRAIALISVLTLVFSLVPTHNTAQAATITYMRDYLNRQQADVASGIQHEIFFKEGSGKTGTDGEVRIIFPDGDDTKWCRTTGSLTLTAITEPTGTFVSGEGATGLLGTLSGTCAQGSGSGSAESNSDRLLITGVGALVATTNYGVRVVANTAVLGTAASAANNIKVIVNDYEDSGTLEDAGTLAVALVADEQIQVSATVDPTLTVALAGDPVDLGTLSTANINYDAVTSTVTTNATSGYVSVVKYNNTLTSGSNTIPDTTGGTIAPGTSEYGVSSSDTDVSSIIATTNTSPACSTTQQTETGTRAASALTTTFKQYAGATAPASADVTTLCFIATIGATQSPGTYTSISTLVTTARF